MAQIETFEQLDYEIKPEQNHAQILFRISLPLSTFEEGRKIIEGLGVHIIDKKYLLPNLLLVKLDVMDMRNVVLKLIENGFSNIHGINAANFKSPQG